MSEAPLAATLAARALDALHDVIDPEVGINVVDLGLVYGVEADGRRLHVRLTMTTPACLLGEHIVRGAEAVLRSLEGVDAVKV